MNCWWSKRRIVSFYPKLRYTSDATVKASWLVVREYA